MGWMSDLAMLVANGVAIGAVIIIIVAFHSGTSLIFAFRRVFYS